MHEVDAVLVGGRLIPNSELAMHAGLEVELPSRQPRVKSRLSCELSYPGVFAVGNMVGHVSPAQWCQFHGQWVSRAVAKYVDRQ